MSTERRGGARAYSGPPRQTYTLDKDTARKLQDLVRLGQDQSLDRQTETEHAIAILRDLVRDAWTELKKAKQQEKIMKTHIWKHIPSGEQYAVTLRGDNTVTAAAGPLHHRELTQALSGDWDSDGQLVEDINANLDDYRDATAD